ncbi:MULTISPECIES: ATP-binding protein [unclassified Polaromonas]|uniref:sensor histidine kinase n=1 Tax=unclassified Polaromonas TaxID=2638319 RepID=UPI0025F285FE|nr:MULTISPECIES: ATP-binding protein [unclassified Polaromonas]
MNPSIRLLHLEDNPLDAELIRLRLEAAGLSCDIRWVSGKEAFESALAQETFDLVLADSKLPGYDGLSALRHVRERQPELPVIMMSGELSEEAAVDCLKAGATDYVLKQRPQRLDAAVRRALVEKEELAALRRAEEEVRRQSLFLRQVIDLNPTFIFAKDRAGRFVLVNQAMAEAYGSTVEEMLGKAEADVTADAQEVARFLKADLETMDTLREVFIPEEKLIDATGKVRWLQTVKRPIVAADGTADGVLGVAADITERKRAQEEILRLNADLEERVRQRTAQLEAANKELEAFSYSVSHDLRSPLNTIDGFSQLLEQAAGDKIGDKGQHYLSRIRAGTQQMSELIDGLLSLAKLSRDQLRSEAVDLSAVSRKAAQACREGEPERQARIQIQDGLLAHGDPLLLSVVIQNLLGNAWKFTARRAVARINIGGELDASGETVYFVKDNGAGFDMHHAGKLFGAFERLHSHSDFLGTGLGLTIVKRVIDRHGGRVWADSVENEGATFYFTLGTVG